MGTTYLTEGWNNTRLGSTRIPLEVDLVPGITSLGKLGQLVTGISDGWALTSNDAATSIALQTQKIKMNPWFLKQPLSKV